MVSIIGWFISSFDQETLDSNINLFSNLSNSIKWPWPEAFEKKHLVEYSRNFSIKFSSEHTLKTHQTVSFVYGVKREMPFKLSPRLVV